MPLATRTAAQRVQWDIHRATINLIQSFTADVSIVAPREPTWSAQRQICQYYFGWLHGTMWARNECQQMGLFVHVGTFAQTAMRVCVCVCVCAQCQVLPSKDEHCTSND